jgi:hypothetical protein
MVAFSLPLVTRPAAARHLAIALGTLHPACDDRSSLPNRSFAFGSLMHLSQCGSPQKLTWYARGTVQCGPTCCGVWVCWLVWVNIVASKVDPPSLALSKRLHDNVLQAVGKLQYCETSIPMDGPFSAQSEE